MGDLRNINPPICYEPKTDSVVITKDAPEAVKTQGITFALSKQMGNLDAFPDLKKALTAADNCPAGVTATSSFGARANGLKFTPN